MGAKSKNCYGANVFRKLAFRLGEGGGEILVSFVWGSMHVIEYNWGSEDAWAAGGGINKSVCL